MSDKPSTGWERDVPVNDSLMRAYVENYAGEWASYASSAGGIVVRTDRYLLADHGSSAAIFNCAVLLRPVAGELRAVAAEIADRFQSGVGGRIYLWSPWPTVDLASDGWKLEAHPMFAVRAAGTGPPDVPPSVRVERVADPGALADWERVIVDGFGFEDVQPYRKGCLVGEPLLDDPRARLWVAYDGDEPAAAAALHVEHGIAGFALGTTLPTARRRGLWYALVRERLLEEPDLPAASVFSPQSLPGAVAIGFLPITRWTLWSRARD